MDSEPALLRHDTGGGCRLTLNRPPAVNSLSRQLLVLLLAELEKLENDRAARVVVLTGHRKAFSAGHDLKEIAADLTAERLRELFSLCSRFMLGLTRLPQPVIAGIEGIATAAGCQL